VKALVRIEGLTVELGGREVLSDVSFEIRPGEIVTVIGPNGSGKTTLLRVLIGAIRPKAGHIRRAPGLRIGYVPQRLQLDATMPLTVARFLSLPVRHEAREISAMLARVGIAGLEARQIAELSGGQFQRALLARALLANPRLLILDEPTQALDQPGIAAFYRLIEDLRRELGCAVPAAVLEAPQYRALFGDGTGGLMALYRHHHDHSHDAAPEQEEKTDAR